MKQKLILVLCLVMMSAAQARGQFGDSIFEGADKILVSNGPVVIRGGGFTAYCGVSISAYYDQDHKNFIGFKMCISYIYNPGPGMSECAWLENKFFKKVVPVDGKVRLKFTTRARCGDSRGGYDILKAEGKTLEVTAKAIFDGKKYIETKDKILSIDDMPRDRFGNVDYQKLYSTKCYQGLRVKRHLRVVKADPE